MLAFRVAAGATAVMALLITVGAGEIELPATGPVADVDPAVLPVAGTIELAGRATAEAADDIASDINARRALLAGDSAASAEAGAADPGLARLREEIEAAALDEEVRRGLLGRLAEEGDTAVGRAVLLAELRAALLK